MDMRVELQSSITAIDAAAWDGLAGAQSLYLSHRWLTWAERDQNFAPRYALVRDDHGRMLGALATYLWHGIGSSVDAWYDPWRVFVAPHVSASGRREEWLPVLLLGSRSGYHSDLLLDGSIDELQKLSVVRLLLSAVESVSDESGAVSTALMYLPGETLRLVGGIAGHRAHTVPTSAEAVIDVRWSSFEEYLRQFARRRRGTLKAEINAFESTGAEVREDSLGATYGQIAPLLARLRRKHGASETARDVARHLREQAEALDGISRVFLEMRAGRVVGFSLCYEWAGALYVRAAGFDNELGSARFAYFNLALYRPLRHAIEHDLREINLGASSYQAKISRGASLIPLWSIIWAPIGSDPAVLAALRQPAREAAEASAFMSR
jgi:predicted N-acyltransferase